MAVCVSNQLGTLLWVQEVVLVTDLRNPDVPHASGWSSNYMELEGTARTNSSRTGPKEYYTDELQTHGLEVIH